MGEPSDDELDYLLSRGKLGGTQRERIFENVLAASGHRPVASRRRWYLWGTAGALAATVAVALLLVPRAPDRAPSPFRAKGVAGGPPTIDLVCLGATRQACPRGSLVTFALEGGSGDGGFLTAYADPPGGGGRIWYLTDFPIAGEGGGGSHAVPTAARIGDEQQPGRYRVEIVLARRPLSRAEAAPDSGEVITRAQMELTVVP